MLKYIVKRLVLMIPSLLGITLIVFMTLHLAPGGPVEQQLSRIRFGQGNGGTLGAVAGSQQMVSPEVVEALKRQYGFDQPVWTRYTRWLRNLLRLDFGASTVYGAPALDVIKRRAPVSVAFGLATFVITYAIAVILGLKMALRAHGGFDVAASFGLVVVTAIPVFILGVLLLVFFAGDTFVDFFPVGYRQSDDYPAFSAWGKIWDRLHHAVLPLACYVLGNFSALTFLVRNSVLEGAGKEYARTARAKGVGESRVYTHHILRNSLIPLVTGMGGSLAMFLSGSILVESVFQLDGIGLLGYQAVVSRDYNVMMALLFLTSMLLLVGNLVTDLIYMAVDPRVRLA